MSWGNSYWRFIHYFAIHNQRETIIQVKNFLPLPATINDWIDPEPNDNLIEWSLAFHNKINTKLNKYDKWDMNDFNIAQKSECDVCVNNQCHSFPWNFIHNVAINPTSMNFLKLFNSTYPCDKCRNTFLDEPLPNESVIVWVNRNHQRIDPSFIPEPIDPLVPVGYVKDTFNILLLHTSLNNLT
jgi:hypothetical protein